MQPEPTNLMHLPTELRLQIYEHAIPQHSPICINRSWQLPPLLELGPGFQDHDAVAKLFFNSHTFVYYLTGLNYGEPNIQPLILRLAELERDQMCYVRKINIVCFWASKDVTIETIRERVLERLKRDDYGRGLTALVGKLDCAHTDEVWKRMWIG